MAEEKEKSIVLPEDREEESRQCALITICGIVLLSLKSAPQPTYYLMFLTANEQSIGDFAGPALASSMSVYSYSS